MKRHAFTGLLALVCAAAQAQIQTLSPAASGLLAAPAPMDPGSLPVLDARQALRPMEQLPGARFSGELEAANAAAVAELSQLRTVNPRIVGGAAPPPNCDRRVLKIGLSSAGFILRPGQFLTVGGCFEGTTPGEVRLNGSFPNGYVRLQVLEWKPTHVHARMPDLSGVYDNDSVRLQLKFGDGDFSNELPGRFRARRAVYAVEGPAIRSLVDYLPLNTPNACSWEACTSALIAPAQQHHVVAIRTATSTLGSYAIKMRNPQFHIMGYYNSVLYGQSQFSNWSANGELVIDWATAAHAPYGHVSVVRFDKVVFDAPVGTPQGATLQAATFQPVAAMPR